MTATVESFLHDAEMLASLVVDMADRYRETRDRGQDVRKGLEWRRRDVEVMATLFEDETSIGAFYQRFAHATMEESETRDLLFDYFISKIFVSTSSMTIASWFFNGGPDIDLSEARETGEVLNMESDTSPSSGDGENLINRPLTCNNTV